MVENEVLNEDWKEKWKKSGNKWGRVSFALVTTRDNGAKMNRVDYINFSRVQRKGKTRKGTFAIGADSVAADCSSLSCFI